MELELELDNYTPLDTECPLLLSHVTKPPVLLLCPPSLTSVAANIIYTFIANIVI